jgi:hypothetical protein
VGAAADTSQLHAQADTATHALPIAVDSLRPDSLLALGRARRFDSLRARTDEQALMGLRGAAGPRAAIQPERGTFRATRQMLASGYVVGRMINLDSLAYPALNLGARDTVYWFVDSTAAGWRATFVSSRAGVKPVSHRMELESHPDQKHLEPAARWVVESTGAAIPWVTCTEGGCCKLS